MSSTHDISGYTPGGHAPRVHRRPCAAGVTLIEVIMASVILVVAALGTLRCQYYAAVHGRIAKAQMSAAHVAQLLLEDWKSTGGSTEYDPARLELGFSDPLAIPSGFSTAGGLGSTLHGGVYAITLGETRVQVMLKHRDVIDDDYAKATLRQLSVIIRFAANDDGKGGESDRRLAEMPPMTLVTYVRIDASNG